MPYHDSLWGQGILSAGITVVENWPGSLPVLCLICHHVNRSERLRGSKFRSRSKSKSRFDAVFPAFFIPSTKYNTSMCFVSHGERRRINDTRASGG